jgi:hypothetical protein
MVTGLADWPSYLIKFVLSVSTTYTVLVDFDFVLVFLT